MRNTRESLRQKWLLKRPHRVVGESVGVSVGAVSLALARAAKAQLTWEVVEALADAELEARLYPSAVAEALRTEPDCTWIHRERHRAGATLELPHHEYLEQHPQGLRYTSFCDRYRTCRGRSRRRAARARARVAVVVGVIGRARRASKGDGCALERVTLVARTVGTEDRLDLPYRGRYVASGRRPVLAPVRLTCLGSAAPRPSFARSPHHKWLTARQASRSPKVFLKHTHQYAPTSRNPSGVLPLPGTNAT
jgi:hypothetical protein